MSITLLIFSTLAFTKIVYIIFIMLEYLENNIFIVTVC